ncbi:MAG: TfoX/Sxy family protein [Chthoniobacteraceae bacterium]
MADRSFFVTYVLEQLDALGDVTARAMFGGHGIYLEGRMFALIAEDTLYLKVDDESRAEFEQAGLKPFRYASSKGEMTMSYYEAPFAAIDDREQLCAWARNAVAAAEPAPKRRSRQR